MRAVSTHGVDVVNPNFAFQPSILSPLNLQHPSGLVPDDWSAAVGT